MFVANNILAQTTTSVSHKYDAFNRLKESSDGTNTTTFSYDELGNRTQESVSVVLSLKDNEILGLKLFPNPTPKMVTITATNNIEKVVIYDAVGKLVKQVKNTKNSVEIGISAFSIGIYNFVIYSGVKKQSAKVVKR